MLVLSRQREESIIIDLSAASDEELAGLQSGRDVIEVMVVDIRGDKVRLGTAAAKSVEVHRREIWDARRREKLEAAKK